MEADPWSHEAGHAVIATSRGWTVVEVAVGPGSRGGYCTYDHEESSTASQHRDEMCVALAGIVAEALSLHEDPHTRVAEVFDGVANLDCPDPPPATEDDRCTVLRAQRHAKCSIAAAVDEVNAELSTRWTVVGAVAAELKRRWEASDTTRQVSLSGEDFSRLTRPVDSRSRPPGLPRGAATRAGR